MNRKLSFAIAAMLVVLFLTGCLPALIQSRPAANVAVVTAVPVVPSALPAAVPTGVAPLVPDLPDGYPPPLATAAFTPYPPPAATATPFTYPAAETPAAGVPRYGYRIVETFPHDRAAYTQGLVVESDGVFLESTGLRGESSLRRVTMQDGTVQQLHALADQYFGEGIALVDDRIVQLTWQEQTGFVYDQESFAVLDTFSYPHEGWGLAYDGRQLLVSDGTDELRYWDPATLVETGSVRVRDQGQPVFLLNELEWVEGEVWANIYRTDLVARIDPATGEVLGWIDLAGLLAPEDRNGTEDVLNGIAYDAENGRLFVTGKRWPLLFEIELTGPA